MIYFLKYNILLILFLIIQSIGCKKGETTDETEIFEAGGLLLFGYFDIESSSVHTTTLSIEVKFFERYEDFPGYYGYYPEEGCEKIEYEDYDNYMHEYFDIPYLDAGEYVNINSRRATLRLERDIVERGPIYRISISGPDVEDFIDGYNSFSIEVPGGDDIESFSAQEGIILPEKVVLKYPETGDLGDYRGEDIPVEWEGEGAESFLIDVAGEGDKDIVCNVEDNGRFTIDDKYTSAFTPESISLLRIELLWVDVPNHSPLWSYGIALKQLISD